jgi:hypothetical protein
MLSSDVRTHTFGWGMINVDLLSDTPIVPYCCRATRLRPPMPAASSHAFCFCGANTQGGVTSSSLEVLAALALVGKHTEPLSVNCIDSIIVSRTAHLMLRQPLSTAVRVFLCSCLWNLRLPTVRVFRRVV